MAITRYAGDRFVAATADTKPTGVLPGAFLTVSGDGSRLNYIKTGYTVEAWAQIQGGGGGNPGGSNTQVQFNDNGAFGGSTGLTFDGQRLYANNFELSGILYDSNASVGEGGMVLANEGATGVHWKNIESVLSGVGGSGVANYVAKWSDEDTLTSGTIYDDGDVGIGTASPSAKLHVYDTVVSDMVILESSGPSAVDGPDVVFYRNSASPADSDDLGILKFRGRNDNSQDVNYVQIEGEAISVADGAEGGALNFHTYNNGTSAVQMVITGDNVGIGTTAPAAKLHVDGSTIFGDISSNDWGSTFSMGLPAGNGLLMSEAGLANNSNRLFLFYNASGSPKLEMYQGNTTRKVVIDSNGASYFMGGDVGIGTTTPVGLLDIIRVSNTAPAFRIGSSNLYGWGFFSRASTGDLSIERDNNTTYSPTLYIKRADGNVGIGTTDPATKLHLYDSSDVYLTLESSGGTAEEVAVKYNNFSTGTNFWWQGLNQEAAYSLAYGSAYSGSNVKLFVGTDAKVGIGTNAPEANLHIVGSGSSAWLRLDRTTTSSNAGIILHTSSAETDGAWAVYMDATEQFRIADWIGSDVTRLLIDTSGNVGIGTVAPNTLLHIKGAVNERVYIKIEGSGSAADAAIQFTLGDEAATWTAGIDDTENR
ncbi:MAG TPA: hypothetical protein EYN67_07755, partial [Flavobacteriales bacterium]|nr:hypothetical protein [Flavobacteriales bacterium]